MTTRHESSSKLCTQNDLFKHQTNWSYSELVCGLLWLAILQLPSPKRLQVLVVRIEGQVTETEQAVALDTKYSNAVDLGLMPQSSHNQNGETKIQQYMRDNITVSTNTRLSQRAV